MPFHALAKTFLNEKFAVLNKQAQSAVCTVQRLVEHSSGREETLGSPVHGVGVSVGRNKAAWNQLNAFSHGARCKMLELGFHGEHDTHIDTQPHTATPAPRAFSTHVM